MLIALSPAKSLDYETPLPVVRESEPRMLAESAALVRKLRGFSAKRLGALMAISDPLARLNVARFTDWGQPSSALDGRAAVLAFDGDVYRGLRAREMDLTDLDFAQKHLRILSGLYGVLRPLDRIEPYRLEMGTGLATRRGKSLYAFWGARITDLLAHDIREVGAGALVNLASDEYFKSVKSESLTVPVIQPVFLEQRGAVAKVISFSAKRARGTMARFAIEQRITSPEQLKSFDQDGYRFVAAESTKNRWVFIRQQP
jgi:uncharacterized protein